MRFCIFPNGNFTNGGGKVVSIGSDATWAEFKARCLRKLFLSASLDAAHEQQEALSNQSKTGENEDEIDKGKSSRPLATSTTSLRIERVWLANGAEVESMDELESGDVLYLSIDPRQPFIPPPPSHSHFHLPRSSSSTALAAARGVVSAPPEPLSGLLVWNGRQHYVQLLPNAICWALQGDVYQQLPYDEIVGVSRSRRKNGFILHSYPLKNPNQAPGLNNDRYLKTYEFICPSEELLFTWLVSVRTVLKQPFFAPSAVPLASDAGASGDDGQDERPPVNGIPSRRLLVFVNPFGGTGLGRKVWKQVRPMFLVANIDLHLVETKYAGHAGEVAASLDIEKYDGIVTISGDGLLHEVVNAILRRPDWKEAVKVPLGIIPSGSGNGLAASISCYTPTQAAFAIVKGKSRPFDMFSILQEGQKKRFGFLDVAWGFISDVDFDSEVFRWMGKARFTVTAIEKLVSNDSYRARISFILADFVQQPCVQIHCPVCASAAHARQLNEMLSIAGSGTAVEPEKLFQGLADESDGDPTDEDDYDGSKSGSDGQQTRLLVNDEEKFDEEEEVGPGLRYIGRRAAKANWKVIEDNFSLFVASNVRGISTDTFLTPYAHLSDGCLDVCFMRSASRANLTKVLLDNEKGDGAHLGIEGVEYVKVKALVIEPLVSSRAKKKVGKMGVDGEILPPTAVQVEVHQALLSLFHPCC
jgi:sphingosine kinase